MAEREVFARVVVDEFQVATEKTFGIDDLMDPMIVTQPMNFANWRLRMMALEYQRRGKVMSGRADPTPFEPWRVCDPADLKAWMKKHESRIEDRAAATKRDNYGLTGKKAIHKKRKI